jgi:phospholipid/cholesterol/gamma-HCH transport system permease protein
MAGGNSVVQSISHLGDAVAGNLFRFGRFCVFSTNAVAGIPSNLGTLRGWRRFLPQAFAIGTQSVPVIMLTGAFVGMVLVVQGWSQFDAAGLSDHLGAIVNISVASELGPVLAGVMLAGRVGGALTAELGTMNVTEQLLALRSMGNDPVRFLVTPRFIACLALTPVLTCYADVMGGLGAWLVYAGVFGGDSGAYWHYTRQTVQLWDLGTGVVKAVFFGGSIGVISCYKGFHCRGGAEGVGRACTEAFVASFIVILVLDFFLNILINHTYEIWYLPRSLI